MLFTRSIGLLSVLGLALVEQAVAGTARLDQRAIIPAQDSFYKAPSNLKSLKPGAIIRTRRVTIANTNNVNAFQILYRTTPANNSVAVATATTLIVPNGADLTKLVSYNIAQDSVNTKCAPSYTLQQGGNSESAIIQQLLGRGWAVTIADYEGPDSAFTAGRYSAHGVLDAIRATLAFKDTSAFGFSGFKAGTKVVLTGYSGGATAASWASALAPTYAPELPLAGAAFGGTPANLADSLAYIDGTFYAGFDFTGVLGLSRAYSALSNRLNAILTTEGKAAFTRVAGLCSGDALGAFFNERFQSTKYQTLGANYLQDPVVKSVYDQQILGSVKAETPSIPIYVYHASKDDVIPIKSIQKTVSNWCANGAKSIDFVTSTGNANHITMVLFSIGDVLNFIDARFKGTAPLVGCRSRTVNY